MLLERRKHARGKLNRVAQFYSEICPNPRACMVTDISEGGARLYSEIAMPPVFTLSMMHADGTIERECRVVWQLGGELGVEFIGRARS